MKGAMVPYGDEQRPMHDLENPLATAMVLRRHTAERDDDEGSEL